MLGICDLCSFRATLSAGEIVGQERSSLLAQLVRQCADAEAARECARQLLRADRRLVSTRKRRLAASAEYLQEHGQLDIVVSNNDKEACGGDVDAAVAQAVTRVLAVLHTPAAAKKAASAAAGAAAAALLVLLSLGLAKILP